MISTPRLQCDPEMQHVIVVIGESTKNMTAIDASFSQFLGYVGMDYNYENLSNTDVFPKEEIIKFALSESALVAEWLTSVAISFRRKNVHPVNKWGMDVGQGPLEAAPRAVLLGTYTSIWNPSNLSDWSPPQYVIDDGIAVAQYIPEGCVIIT